MHREADPLLSDEQASPAFRRSAASLRALERTVLAADGQVLRYGYFYGPASAFSATGSMGQDVRKRRSADRRRRAGVWSFIHVHDAAVATVAALAAVKRDAYNVVDDDPAPVSEWLPV